MFQENFLSELRLQGQPRSRSPIIEREVSKLQSSFDSSPPSFPSPREGMGNSVGNGECISRFGEGLLDLREGPQSSEVLFSNACLQGLSLGAEGFKEGGRLNPRGLESYTRDPLNGGSLFHFGMRVGQLKSRRTIRSRDLPRSRRGRREFRQAHPSPRYASHISPSCNRAGARRGA